MLRQLLVTGVSRAAVTLHVGEGEPVRQLSASWLLDHARESRQSTAQRGLLVSEGAATAEPSVLDAHVRDGELRVTWAADAARAVPAGTTTYDLAELALLLRAPHDAVRRERWTAGLFSRPHAPVVDAHALRTDDGLVHALSHLRAFGVLRIDGMPATRDATRALVLRIGAPRSTYYSAEMWSTRAAPGERKGINDTAYTSVGIRPHTDGTYFRDPPGLQILNCVSQAERGGESLVVDALSVVESLRAAAPATLDFLARTPLPWFSYDEDVRSGLPIRLSTHEPVLRFDASGDLDQFRYNEYDRGDLAPGEWYDSTFLPHWRALVEQVNAPAHVEHVRLEPGQCLVVDNQRVLHGRTPFDGGVREMVGCYVGRDEYESRLRSVGLLRMCG
ncbi:hypothetical protein KFE25_006444 [Diacronema lutheri]|uniref:TauD/TfdA-like domain-containing protein n=2 Tax=Diacronema lutheri TaxID=2081491 RepID=A0A8J6CET4_DIALT|nr:hypothetical protein KFE25_006444 [Diacronema lutheri]